MKPVPKEIIAYEVANCPISKYVSFKWGQNILGKYYGRKCYRKWKRYQETLEVSTWMKKNGYYAQN